MPADRLNGEPAARPDLPDIDAVRRAHERVAPLIVRTPLLSFSDGNGEILVKCENFQRTGAFKIRGALNALLTLDAAARARGVVTYSSGNHAQAVAYAARMLDVRATILMPTDAAPEKRRATADLGATIIEYNRAEDDRDALRETLTAQHGYHFVHPYDDAAVIAGQGTVALELFEQTPDVDCLFLPLGGGGLLAGCAIVAVALAPACRVVGVEPLAGNDGEQSLAAGRIVTIPPPSTIADGAMTTYLGEANFALMRRCGVSIETATDGELADSMRRLFIDAKLVAEPTACLGFARARAALMKGSASSGRVCAIISGGNVSPERFRHLTQHMDRV